MVAMSSKVTNSSAARSRSIWGMARRDEASVSTASAPRSRSGSVLLRKSSGCKRPWRCTRRAEPVPGAGERERACGLGRTASALFGRLRRDDEDCCGSAAPSAPLSPQSSRGAMPNLFTPRINPASCESPLLAAAFGRWKPMCSLAWSSCPQPLISHQIRNRRNVRCSTAPIWS
jgi:hypothetical protein